MHDTRPANHPPADPVQVAETWSALLEAGSLDELMELYGPRAPLHTARDVLVGPEAIREFWERSPLRNGPSPERVVQANGVGVVRWSVRPDEGTVVTTELLVRHGHIVEQWIGEALLTASVLGTIPLEFSHSGVISAGDRQGVIEALEKVLDGVTAPVTHVRVRMEHSSDRNRDRPTSIRAVVDMKGGALRADVYGETTQAAVDALESRLRSQVRDRIERRQALQHRGAGVGSASWRHGDRTTYRPDYFPRPPEERQIVRHKSVAPTGSRVEEAAFDLSSMDYDFYLFTESCTDGDALLHHDPDSDGYVVRLVGEVTAEVLEDTDGVGLDDRPVPTLSCEEARERLDVGHEPWVFYVDREVGRGHVLYRRYDGHYGLIVPLDEPD
jgi:ribosome-associated translation inhibitor RaiA